MELDAVVAAPVATKNKSLQKCPDDDSGRLPMTRKKRSVMHLFRVALYMLKSGGKSKPVAASNWNKLLGSMRPLHVHSEKSPPPLIEDAPARPEVPPPVAVTKMVAEELDSNHMSPGSPAQKSVASSSMSQYASALNLQELDVPSDDEEEGETFYDGEGDSMIDAKADLFIAHFYQQMKLQQEAYTTHRKERTRP